MPNPQGIAIDTQLKFGLERVGEPRGVPADALQRARPALPDAIVALLTEWGPGRLCGRFDVVTPDDPRVVEFVARMRSLQSREAGRFAALSPRELADVSVFALDDANNALAFGAASGVGRRRSYLLLANDGRVIWIGDGFEAHVVEAFLLGGALQRFEGVAPSALRAPPNSYACGEVVRLAAVLQRLHAGDEAGADELLPEYVASGDPAAQQRALLAAMLGEAGGAIEDTLRRDYVRQVARMLFRIDARAAQSAPSDLARHEGAFPSATERAWGAELSPASEAAPPRGAPAVHEELTPLDPALDLFVTPWLWSPVDVRARVEAAAAAWREADPTFEVDDVLSVVRTLPTLVAGSLLEATLVSAAMLPGVCRGDGTLGLRNEEESWARDARIRGAQDYLDAHEGDAGWALHVLMLRDAPPPGASRANDSAAARLAAALAQHPLARAAARSIILHSSPHAPRVGPALAQLGPPDDAFAASLVAVASAPCPDGVHTPAGRVRFAQWASARRDAFELLTLRHDLPAARAILLAGTEADAYVDGRLALRGWELDPRSAEFASWLRELQQSAGPFLSALMRIGGEPARETLRPMARGAEAWGVRVFAAAALTGLGERGGDELVARALRDWKRWDASI